MKLMKRIWFRIGNHYRKKRDFEQALKYMRKGESAITSFNDKSHYAELAQQRPFGRGRSLFGACDRYERKPSRL